ncbi:hypothetical protein KUTeg_013919 [Tegillarca granosa]|uniref:Signal recognition particle 14 kDa protein n=1 Tax=Tegillarca granosa TaxID=220873 RepID=A0ABQ9F078_TEGGR|nr:hypothetical protein KUTeg_013919 [Tegillarca granosa]
MPQTILQTTLKSSSNNCFLRVDNCSMSPSREIQSFSNISSGIVDHKDVNRFQMAYSNLLKGNMDGLKKKDKKATTKGKSKATQ